MERFIAAAIKINHLRIELSNSGGQCRRGTIVHSRRISARSIINPQQKTELECLPLWPAHSWCQCRVQFGSTIVAARTVTFNDVDPKEIEQLRLILKEAQRTSLPRYVDFLDFG